METDSTFTRCMVKKSKHYYKEVLKAVGILLGLFVICMAGFFGLEWLNSQYNFAGSAISAVILIWIIIIGVISMVSALYSEHFWISLAKFFIGIHIFMISAVLLIIIWFTCFMGITVTTAGIVLLCAGIFFNNSPLIGAIVGIISAILVLPINYAAFECFKIDEFIESTWSNMTGRLNVWLK